jgi:hypothetical protein
MRLTRIDFSPKPGAQCLSTVGALEGKIKMTYTQGKLWDDRRDVYCVLVMW